MSPLSSAGLKTSGGNSTGGELNFRPRAGEGWAATGGSSILKRDRKVINTETRQVVGESSKHISSRGLGGCLMEQRDISLIRTSAV